MTKELVLENYGVMEMDESEKIELDGGGDLKDPLKKIFKFTWKGFGDGKPSNDEVHLEIFGFQLF